MAGHNKWSKIKRKKGDADHKRSQVFGRIIKEIMVAVKEGGGTDPSFNSRLRVAISNAKGANMPKDNIERAIKKASEADNMSFHEPSYEGYAPDGIAVYVECTTDNLNRTVASVRAAFSKYGGNLATSGSVDFLFDRKGIFVIKQAEFNPDELELELIDAGAEDIELDEEEYTITTSMNDFGLMMKKLEELGAEIVNAGLQQIATQPQEVSVDTAKKVMRLLDALEDDDDVKAVYHNMEISDEVLELLDAE